jgi:DoxX-like family
LAYQQPVFADTAGLTAARRVGRGLYQLTSDQDATCRVRFHDRRFRNDVTPTDARDEPSEAADHPEMAADAVFVVSARSVEIAWGLALQEVTMNLALWIIAGALAVMFALSGLMMLGVPKDKLVASGNMAAAEGFSQAQIRWIGAAEFCGAVGLIAPAVVHIAPVLVPIAAVGLLLVMVGAAVVHGRRGEVPMVAMNVLLLALAATVVWGRFGPYAFAM